MLGAWDSNPCRMGNFATHWGNHCKVLQRTSGEVESMVQVSHSVPNFGIYGGHNRVEHWAMAWNRFKTLCI